MTIANESPVAQLGTGGTIGAFLRGVKGQAAEKKSILKNEFLRSTIFKLLSQIRLYSTRQAMYV